MSKVEEVARAICKAECEPAGCGYSVWDESLSIADRNKYRTLARFALEANAAPTTAMIDAGVAFALNVSLGGDYTWSRYVADLYEHMTRATLSEEGR